MRVVNIRQPKQVQFETGDMANVSAIYRSVHVACEPARLWLRSGERFPVCSCCGKNATYILIQEVQHVYEDPDFMP